MRVLVARCEVVYIDLDHLHLYPCPNPDVQRENTRDLLNQ